MIVSMGSYDSPRVHLRKMGCWDADNAYVSRGSVLLHKELV